MSPSSGWHLVMVSGDADGRSYPITEGGLHLGRGEDCDIPLASQNVSRSHARVVLYQGNPHVSDTGSRNGVFVNGTRVQQMVLKEGDTVSLGEFTFRISAEDGAASGRSKRPLLYAVGLLLVLGVGIAIVTQIGSGPSQVQVATQDDNQTSGASSQVQDMFSNSQQGTSGRTGNPSSGSSETKSGGLAQEVSANSSAQKGSSKEYLERAEFLQEAGKLTEALEYYQMALKLDAECVLCATRAERIQKEIKTRITRYLDDGMKSFNALRYEEAINSWQMVLNLAPDPADQFNQLATRYIADAESRLASQQR